MTQRKKPQEQNMRRMNTWKRWIIRMIGGQRTPIYDVRIQKKSSWYECRGKREKAAGKLTPWDDEVGTNPRNWQTIRKNDEKGWQEAERCTKQIHTKRTPKPERAIQLGALDEEVEIIFFQCVQLVGHLKRRTSPSAGFISKSRDPTGDSTSSKALVTIGLEHRRRTSQWELGIHWEDHMLKERAD